MSKSVEAIVTPFYCQMALRLCAQARRLCELGECAKRAEICRFVSTLCRERGFRLCAEESELCRKVADLCSKAKRGSEACLKAEEMCTEARKLCPHNYVIQGG